MTILSISGSLRAGSTNTSVIATARAVAPPMVTVSTYEGLAELPHFNPDDDAAPLPPAVAGLRSRIGAADALLLSTPEYAGGLPGSFKNLLDWTIGGGEIYGKPVAWINASTSGTGAADAHDSLRRVLRYAGAEVVEAACAHIPVARDAVGPDGIILDAAIRDRIRDVLSAIVRHVEQAPVEQG